MASRNASHAACLAGHGCVLTDEIVTAAAGWYGQVLQHMLEPSSDDHEPARRDAATPVSRSVTRSSLDEAGSAPRGRVPVRIVVFIAMLGMGSVTALASGTPTVAAPGVSSSRSLEWADDSPLLGIGSTGAAVESWQAAMNTWLDVVTPDDPFRLATDGVYGRLTDSVTRRFQFSQGLPVDGLVGPVTRAAYLSAPELVASGRSPVAHEPVLAPGDRGDAVAAWQAAVNRWAAAADAPFGPLAVDGVYGPATEAATRQFQQAQAITVDGLVGPETQAALASAPALVNVSSSSDCRVADAHRSAFCAGHVTRRRDLLVDDAPIVEIVLAPDVPSPRCVTMSGDHRLRIVNDGAATTVALGDMRLDLAAGASVTSPQPVGAYVGAGDHTMDVERYGGSGPEVRTHVGVLLMDVVDGP